MDLLLSIMRQLVAALQHVHGAKWLHRDIKPANALYFADGTVKLADFGCAVKISELDPYMWKCVLSCHFIILSPLRGPLTMFPEDLRALPCTSEQSVLLALLSLCMSC